MFGVYRLNAAVFDYLFLMADDLLAGAENCGTAAVNAGLT
jgi:hypothetical protein